MPDRKRSEANTSRKPAHIVPVLLYGFGVLLVLVCIYFAVAHALILAGKHHDAELDITDPVPVNPWLELAEPIASWMPDFHEVSGRYYLETAFKVDAGVRQPALEKAVKHFDEAMVLRPNWPYYPIDALVALANYRSPAEQAQYFMQKLIDTHSPNERGVHKRLFDVGFALWYNYTEEQRQWILQQASIPNGETLFHAMRAAGNYGSRGRLCRLLQSDVSNRHWYCRKLFGGS